MELKLISHKEASNFLNTHHYLKKISKGSVYCFGAYLQDKLHGVVCYSTPIARCIWKGLFKSEVKVLELSRLAISSGVKASELISKTLKLIDCDAVISYADTSVGHVGIVYQASNWLYLGTTNNKTEYYLKSNPSLHSRTLFGSHTLQQLQEKYGSDLDKRERGYKLKYIYLKTKKAKKEFRAPTESYVKSINNAIKKYIYCWTNNLNSKKYVGKTSRPISIRYPALNPVNGSNSKLFNLALAKHGIENFSCSILEELSGDTTSEVLREKELYWINKLNTLRPYGYNISIPDETNSGKDIRLDLRGLPRSSDVKEKIRRNWENETRKKRIAKLVSPEGKLVEVLGLLPFIENNNLSIKDKRNLEALLNGERHHVKGWRLYQKESDLIPFDKWKAPKKVYEHVMTERRTEHINNLAKVMSKTYWLLSPEGYTLKIKSLNSFSSKLGISNSNFLNVIAGRRTHTFGWKKSEETPTYLEWSDGKLSNPFNLHIQKTEWMEKLN